MEEEMEDIEVCSADEVPEEGWVEGFSVFISDGPKITLV